MNTLGYIYFLVRHHLIRLQIYEYMMYKHVVNRHRMRGEWYGFNIILVSTFRILRLGTQFHAYDGFIDAVLV